MANTNKRTGPAVQSPLTASSIKSSIEEAFDKAKGTKTALPPVAQTGSYHWDAVMLITNKRAIAVRLPLKLLMALDIGKGKADALSKALVAQAGITDKTQVSAPTADTTDAAGVSNQLEIISTRKNIYREINVGLEKGFPRGTKPVRTIRNLLLRIPPIVPIASVGVFLFHLNEQAGANAKATKIITGNTYAIPVTLAHAKAIADELAKGD